MQVEQIKALIEAMNESQISELTYKSGEVELTLSKPSAGQVPIPVAAPQAVYAQPIQVAPQQVQAPASVEVAAAPAAPVAPVAVASSAFEQKSPMVGTVYLASGPDAAPYVKVGDTVKKGSVLCIIEAMKLMNEIECEKDGVIAEVCVSNESPVEFGTVLFRIK